jgi:hypothetical protein
MLTAHLKFWSTASNIFCFSFYNDMKYDKCAFINAPPLTKVMTVSNHIYELWIDSTSSNEPNLPIKRTYIRSCGPCWGALAWELISSTHPECSSTVNDPDISQFIKRRDWLTMGYFDNLDNGSLNKYKKKILEMKKSL